MARVTVPARLADLEFELEVPAGFAEPPLPGGETDFADPSVTAPLTLLASPVAAAFVTVSARPAYDGGSVMEWFGYLLGHHGITATSLMPATVGGRVHRHGAVVAEGHQTQEGTLLRMVMALVEDGGRLVVVHAMCPDELWASYGEGLRGAVMSFELARPKGPTAPLVPGAAVSPRGVE